MNQTIYFNTILIMEIYLLTVFLLREIDKFMNNLLSVQLYLRNTFKVDSKNGL